MSMRTPPALLCTIIAVGATTATNIGANAQNVPVTSQVAVDAETTENDRIVHVLNRLGFGPRPGDIARVKKSGIKSYLEAQLHPEKIDDSALESKLRAYAELRLSDAEIVTVYNQLVAVELNADSLRRRMQSMDGQSGAAAANTMDAGSMAPGRSNSVTTDSVMQLAQRHPEMMGQVEENRRRLTEFGNPVGLLHEEFSAEKLLRAVESNRQLQEVLVDFWSNHFNIDIRKSPCGVLKVMDDRDVIRPHVLGKFRDLLEASAKSPAMLVYLDNFQSTVEQPGGQPDDRPAPRNHPTRSSSPGQMEGLGFGNRPRRGSGGTGLNENYAREIMELHTLGVDGGYSEHDVHEVARCFTGWSIGSAPGKRAQVNRYIEAGTFQYFAELHDNGEKTVLGHRIAAGGGIQDGETVLAILAESPATMKHVSYELCQRLICDVPPASLVDKCVQTWKATDGDIRKIVETIITSDEFFSPVAIRKKIKSPYEFAVSSIRALNANLDPSALVSRRQPAREATDLIRPPKGGGYLDYDSSTLIGEIASMGQPIFQYQAPTGFSENSQKWVSSGALISRINFSLALCQGRIDDVVLARPSENMTTSPDAGAKIDRLAERFLPGGISPSTRAALIGQVKADDGASGANPMSTDKIAALLLGSPDFQRR